MTAATEASPAILIPTFDPTPVEKAAVDGIGDGFDPETFLWITFQRPDGGARVWYAWTAGGDTLGDQIDRAARAAAHDAADWFEITSRHCEHSTRGRIAIQAHPLRPILADVQTGVDAGDMRDRLLSIAALARGVEGERLPRWLGVGPALLTGGGR